MSSTDDRTFRERDFNKIAGVRELLNSDHGLGLRVNYLPMLAELLEKMGLEESAVVVRQALVLLDEISDAYALLENTKQAPCPECLARQEAMMGPPAKQAPCPWCAKYRKYKLEDLIGPNAKTFEERCPELVNPYPPLPKPWVNPLHPTSEEDRQVGAERWAAAESMKANSTIGSSFEDWLVEEGIKESVEAAAKARVEAMDRLAEKIRDLPRVPKMPETTAEWRAELAAAESEMDEDDRHQYRYDPDLGDYQGPQG